MFTNNTERFSNRSDDYARYRPGYPDSVVFYLRQEFGLTTNKIIADVGAGTGISSKLFLDAGYEVIAVEPNAPMREKSIELLGDHSRFKAVDGTAETTNLPDQCVDAAVAGQAFHWFDAEKSRAEFRRILRPGGLIVLMWNERKLETEGEQDLESLIARNSNNYISTEKRFNAAQVETFFGKWPHSVDLANQQIFDFDGLMGRLTSSSFIPQPDEPGYAALEREARAWMDQYAMAGEMIMRYDLHLLIGRIDDLPQH